MQFARQHVSDLHKNVNSYILIIISDTKTTFDEHFSYSGTRGHFVLREVLHSARYSTLFAFHEWRSMSGCTSVWNSRVAALSFEKMENIEWVLCRCWFDDDQWLRHHLISISKLVVVHQHSALTIRSLFASLIITFYTYETRKHFDAWRLSAHLFIIFESPLVVVVVVIYLFIMPNRHLFVSLCSCSCPFIQLGVSCVHIFWHFKALLKCIRAKIKQNKKYRNYANIWANS